MSWERCDGHSLGSKQVIGLKNQLEIIFTAKDAWLVVEETLRANIKSLEEQVEGLEADLDAMEEVAETERMQRMEEKVRLADVVSLLCYPFPCPLYSSLLFSCRVVKSLKPHLRACAVLAHPAAQPKVDLQLQIVEMNKLNEIEKRTSIIEIVEETEGTLVEKFAIEKIDLQLRIVEEQKATAAAQTELVAVMAMRDMLVVEIDELREERRATSPPPTPTSAPPPDDYDNHDGRAGEVDGRAGEVATLKAELLAWETNAQATAAKHLRLMEQMSDQFIDLEDALVCIYISLFL